MRTHHVVNKPTSPWIALNSSVLFMFDHTLCRDSPQGTSRTTSESDKSNIISAFNAMGCILKEDYYKCFLKKFFNLEIYHFLTILQMLSKSVENGNSCLADAERMHSAFLFNMMLAMDFLFIDLVVLRYIPSIPDFSKFFE